ncbi:MAG: TRAP transporter substrate-binding protein DctP [Alcaligenaceae bacterium]|jgi:TRAP-type C4-dicarboxylate transport system substrate-binding protein|nr:TRAP transporter substrate-binding protein DctP [Alcaligenaceae bacterium]
MFSIKKLTGIVGATILTASILVPAKADTLRFAVGFPSGAPIESAKKYAEAVKELTNNKHRVRIFELSLLSHSEMKEGISKGLADVGYLLTAYSPSDYPFSNMGADMSMAVALNDKIPDKEGFAYSGAMLEYIMLNCEECLGEFKKNNQVYTGVVSTPVYNMFCNSPVDTIEEVKGKRIRISGAPWARWVREFGAQPVALPIGEAYEALSQGVIDCTFFSATELTNFNLIEVVKNIVTDIPGGLYAAGGASTLNKTRWDKFSTEEKEAFLKAGSVMTSEITYRYQEQAMEDLEKAQKAGINIMQADPELLKKSHEFIAKDLAFIPEFYAQEYKLDSPRLKELSETMSTLVDKWSDIIAEADINSAEDLQTLYWNEVYSKIDPEQYGN